VRRRDHVGLPVQYFGRFDDPGYPSATSWITSTANASA
jgi:hypothetical protein